MDITIDQQVALDEALVPHASRLRIGKSNFRLRSDIKSKELTLQVVYDVLKLTPFYKAFLVTANVPEIYMQEFWATATFDELPFKEEILAFLRELGHSEIKMITNVNINKLHQPWRSFAAVINKCLGGKSTGYDSLRLSQAQIIWGMYHKKNMDFAYLLWEDFVYQVEYKDAKKSNEMYYPRFTKVIVNFFMAKGQSIPRKNKEYYAIASGAEPPKPKASIRKKQSSSDTAVPPLIAKGKRLKTSVMVDKPAKEKQPAKSSKAKGADEGTGIIPGVSDIPTYEYDDEEISWKSSEDDDDDDDDEKISEHDDDVDDQSDDDDDDDEQTNLDNDGDDFVHPKFSTQNEEDKDEESFDPIVQTPSQVENTDDEDNNEDSHGMNVEGDKGANEEDKANELYRDVNINLIGRDVQMADVQITQVIEDTHVNLTPVNLEGQQQSSSVSSRFVSNMLNPSPDTGIDSIFESTLRVDVLVMTTAVLPLLSATTLPPPSIPIISHVQQTPAPHQQMFQAHLCKTFPVLAFCSAADLSELELKKILIDKIESNKSIHRSDEQKNLYKALVDAYEREKLILDTYGDTVTLKRRLDDEDKDEEPSKQTKPPTPDRAWNKTLLATHGRIQPWINNLAKKADSRTSFNELMDTPIDFSAFVMNRLKEDTLTPKLLAGPTYERMKGSCKSLVELEFFLEEGRRVIPFDHFINNDHEYLRGGASSRKYTISVTKTKAADYGHIKWIEDLLYGSAINRESAQDVYSKRRIIAVIELQIVEWHNYKHLDWITVRRDEDKLYKFKEGDFKRLRIQEIEDMLLLLKLNLTKPDTYRSDLKRKEAYTTYSNPRGFIYQNKYKQNRLMRIDELHKFIDGTLNDVRTDLDDRLKGIRMQYLPQTIWRQSDKDRAAAMIQAIDKQLKTRRIMQSLEKFVGGRLYEGDFRLLQRTILFII
nr:hypothetical protein [Tanacetum cinerariifolium]